MLKDELFKAQYWKVKSNSLIRLKPFFHGLPFDLWGSVLQLPEMMDRSDLVQIIL